MQAKSEQSLLLTVREVSNLLRVQRPKIYELIRDGAIEGFKVGADWRIRRDSVERLVGAIPPEFFKKNRKVEEESESINDKNIRSALLPD